MIQFVAGVIVGFSAAWLAATTSYRTEIFKRKYYAYRLIHDTVVQVWIYGVLCVEKEDVYRDAFRVSQNNLLVDLTQNMLVLSSKIIEVIKPFLEVTISDIRNDAARIENMVSKVSDTMRRDLHLKVIHQSSVLLWLPMQTGIDTRRRLEGLLEGLSQRRKGHQRNTPSHQQAHPGDGS